MSLLERVFDGERPEDFGRQGAEGGRRHAFPLLYESHGFWLHSGAGRYGCAVIKAYEALGHGADDEAIEHYRETGCLDCRVIGHAEHGKVNQ